MDYVVTKSQQIAVTAESPDEAITKVMTGAEGNPISANYSAQPRPQAPAQRLVPQPGMPAMPVPTVQR